MQKTIILFSLAFSLTLQAQNVNIPDANFKAALLGNTAINTNGDSEIQMSEAAVYLGTINVVNLGISDLTGIEAFTSLTGLDCSYNDLSAINVSSNTALTLLSCSNNALTGLNVLSNTALVTLDCSVNQLTSLNLSANTSLSTLGCNNNNLTSLNVSTNTALTNFVCNNNQLTSLNVSGNTALTALYCGYNSLTSLAVSANTALVTLACYNNQITALNTSANGSLKYLDCQFNQLTSLDVSGNGLLKEIRCYNNQLSNLNVKNGNNPNFIAFYAQNNPNLHCIQVDDPVYMNTNWGTGKDATATFSSNCAGNIIPVANADAEWKVYPNPSSGVFKITLRNYRDATIIVYDILGNVLYKRNAISEAQVDLAGKPAGVYFVELHANGKKSIRKLALE